MHDLSERITSKESMIGILGLGYVGLPLLLSYVEAGFRVIGFDIDPTKIERLQRGESYIEHISSERIAAAQDGRQPSKTQPSLDYQAGGFEATTDFSRTAKCDALILCVPTPLTKYREPDLTYVIATTEAVVPHLRAGQILSLESTTWPGTTDEEIKPRLESTGLVIGQDLFLVFSPEREDPGNMAYPVHKIPKVIGGITPACRDMGALLYKQIIERVVTVSSTRVAEMTKLLENIHRAVNIGLVNELKILSDRMEIDIHEVIEAAATKPFGFTPFYPGPGLGGHCIPIDPFYLTWKAREYGLNTRFIELAGEVNAKMPEWVLGKVTDALNARGKTLKGSRILLLGVAYKKNVDDRRESPAVELLDLLRRKGALVSYSDPHVPTFLPMRKYDFEMTSVPLTDTALSSVDCVLLATDHDRFDYALIRDKAQLIVDTRGRYRDPAPHIVRA